MSSSIAIPKRKQPVRNSLALSVASSSPSSLGSAITSSPSSSSAASSLPTSAGLHVSRRQEKSKVRDVKNDNGERMWESRRSLLGSSFTKSEYTVVNLGGSDGPPRLVTCVKSSQGFDWNQELFLPPYADYEFRDLEHRQDPVHDIVLTDEEAAALLP